MEYFVVDLKDYDIMAMPYMVVRNNGRTFEYLRVFECEKDALKFIKECYEND